jgi:hypothetical protein
VRHGQRCNAGEQAPHTAGVEPQQQDGNHASQQYGTGRLRLAERYQSTSPSSSALELRTPRLISSALNWRWMVDPLRCS